MALFALAYLREHQPELLKKRYHLTDQDLDPAVGNPDLLLTITSKLGFRDDYDRPGERPILISRKEQMGPHDGSSSDLNAEESMSKQDGIKVRALLATIDNLTDPRLAELAADDRKVQAALRQHQRRVERQQAARQAPSAVTSGSSVEAVAAVAGMDS